MPATVKLDIPGGSLTYGHSEGRIDRSIRRHYVEGVDEVANPDGRTAAITAALTATGSSHHGLTTMPLQASTATRFGPGKYFVEQLYYRTGYNFSSTPSAKRHSFRGYLEGVPCVLKRTGTWQNGLPWAAAPTPDQFFNLPLKELGIPPVIVVQQTPELPPETYMLPTPCQRLEVFVKSAVYPVTDAQHALMGKVNNASVVLNGLGRTYAQYEVRFEFADFDQVDNADGTRTWFGVYVFTIRRGGHYQQTAKWDSASYKWLAVNEVPYDSGDFSIF
jgi:hypothetical protein